MILQRLKLRDFRQYRGDNELTFAFGTDKNVTVITGLNGAGKTGIFGALNWVLYGDAAAVKGELVNKAVAGEERLAKASVELHFQHEGTRYVARRIQVRTPSGTEREEEFTLDRLETGGRVVRIPDPSRSVNVILPADARRYFFFDGERIDELSRVGHEADVREAVRSVLKLKVLERAALHLDEVSRESAKALRETGHLTQEQETLIAEREAVNTEMTTAQERLKDLRDAASQLEHELSATRSKLDQMAELRTVQAEEKLVHQSLSMFEAEYEQAAVVLRRAVSGAGPLVAQGAVKRAKEILEEKRARGEIPAGMRQQLIEDLLREGLCICGRHLDDAARSALENRHKSVVPSDVADAVLAAATEVRGLEVRAAIVGRELSEAVTRRETLREQIADTQRREEELHLKLLSDFSEDVAGLERTRQLFDNRLIDTRVETRRVELEIEESKRKLLDILSKLESHEARTGEAQKLKRAYELAVKTGDAARGVLEAFSTDMRGRIEQSTDQIFRELTLKQKTFVGVTVTPDYRLEVEDRFGPGSLVSLSAGERQVLSLSFIAGITRVTGEEAPLVIDTPFGRLSEEVVDNIVEALPKIAKQLVLLVTDREIDDDARKLLEPHIGREYVLRFNDNTSQTSVEVVQ
ncbi:MAG: AAA family ATPase [Chloroflexota bacterium]